MGQLQGLRNMISALSVDASCLLSPSLPVSISPSLLFQEKCDSNPAVFTTAAIQGVPCTYCMRDNSLLLRDGFEAKGGK